MDEVLTTQPAPKGSVTFSAAERATAARPPAGQPRFARRLARHLPTLLVWGVLAALGLYGHWSGWKLPKFSALFAGPVAAPDDWCAEHGVPESRCIECRPDLLPKGPDYGWCKEHGVPNCPWEHPEMAQLKQAPAVSPADRQRAARALAQMDRPENNQACTNYRRRIQFASDAAVKKAGVDVAGVERQPISEFVAANGEITYDQTRFASLSSRLPGSMWRVAKHVGDQASAGEVLGLVDAAEVGRAKTELIQALVEEDLHRTIAVRLQSASAQGAVPDRQVEKAEADRIQSRTRLLGAQQALGNLGLPVDVEELRGLPEERRRQRLRVLGLPAGIARQLGPDATTNLLPLKASQDGTVVACRAVAGEVVDASRVLFQLADTRRMWVTLNVPLEETQWLALGQSVRFRADGSREEVAGALAWISTTADQQTRMVAVRAELPNPGGTLRSGTFGQGRIILREEPAAIVVPHEAIHWEGCCHVVFVRDKGYFERPDSPKVFHVRAVRLGAANEKYREIVAGVLPGEVVATKGSDVLRAELLKGNLGEGCCCGK